MIEQEDLILSVTNAVNVTIIHKASRKRRGANTQLSSCCQKSAMNPGDFFHFSGKFDVVSSKAAV
jgi:hypothetical protein